MICQPLNQNNRTNPMPISQVTPIANPEPRPVTPEFARPEFTVLQPVSRVEVVQMQTRPISPEGPMPVMAELGYMTIGDAYRVAFAEADSLPPTFVDRDLQVETPYTSSREVFHEFMSAVMDYVKEQPSFQHLKSLAATDPGSITKFDIEPVFEAYERGLRTAFREMKMDLTRPQRSELEQALAELNWSYKDVIANHVLALSDGAEHLEYDPADIFLLVNPKARRIEYTSTTEARNLIQHFGSTLNKDVITRDLQRAVPAHLEGAFDDTAALAA